jgi:hypothetical protein
LVGINFCNGPGLRSKGAEAERIVIAPPDIPEEPIPAIPRPTIKTADVDDVAQISEPASKTPKEAKKVYLEENWVYSFPASG